MAAGSYERKSFTGGAQPTSLDAAIGGSPSSFTVASGEGASYPTGNDGPFVVVIGRNTATEEKILITSRVNDQFNINTRGYDDTASVDHDAGEVVEHVLDASTVDQANRFVNLQSAKGDIVAHDGTNTVVHNVGANDYLLTADSTSASGLTWTNPLPTITSNISTNTSNISTNTSNISTNTTAISGLDTRVTALESVPYATLSIASMSITTSYTSGQYYTNGWSTPSGGAVTVVSDPANLINTVGVQTVTLNNRGDIWTVVTTMPTLSMSSTRSGGFTHTEWNNAQIIVSLCDRTVLEQYFTTSPFQITERAYGNDNRVIDLTLTNNVYSPVGVFGANTSASPPSQNLTLTVSASEVRIYQTTIIP